MIIGYVGNMGGGKTLSMIKQAYSKYLQGAKIYSNIELNFPHEKLNRETLSDYANDDEQFINAVFLIDEMHIFLDSRRGMASSNVIMTYFITQTRKKGVDLYFTTQWIKQVDIRLRRLMNMMVQCSTYELLGYLIVEQLIIIHESFGDTYKRHKFIGDEYFGLYNTYEIVNYK